MGEVFLFGAGQYILGNFERRDPLNDGAPTLKIVINFLSGVGENMFFSNSSEFGKFDFFFEGTCFQVVAVYGDCRRQGVRRAPTNHPGLEIQFNILNSCCDQTRPCSAFTGRHSRLSLGALLGRP